MLINENFKTISNKILSCLIILFLSSNISAQQLSTVEENKEKTTTLFDYGEPLTTTESNFKNLIKNFPLFISNSGEGLKLISYKYLTVIKNQEQIRLYVGDNMEVYQSGGNMMSALGGSDIENNRIYINFPESKTDIKTDEKLLKEIEKIISNINIGDEVYKVNLIANGKNYDFNIFVNPTTKQVLKEGNFLGLCIPLNYAEYIEKKIK